MGGGGGGNSGGNFPSATASSSTGTTRGGSSASGGPSNTNFLSGFFRYPYITGLGATDTGAQARTAAVQSLVNDTVPSYGGPTYGTTGRTTGTRGTATVTNRAGTLNRATSQVTSGTADFNAGTTSGSNLQRMPHYALGFRFRPSDLRPEQLLSDVRDSIDRSSLLPSKGRIQVFINGHDVVLRGDVASQEERQDAESLIRLTPGVGQIFNELVVK
jgi:osmotically-inducible protein OsmY